MVCTRTRAHSSRRLTCPCVFVHAPSGGSSVDQSRDMALIILIGFLAMGALSIAVAFLRAMKLAQLMQTFSIVQGLALVGVEGAKNSPYFRAELSAAATYINFVNFDLEIVKPVRRRQA